MIIYKAAAPNGKCYIGQTVQSLAARKSAHYRRATQTPFGNALKKYGDKIKWSVIATAESIAELNVKEKYWIRKLNTVAPHGYNLRAGGKNGGRHNAQTRRKLRAVTTGHIASESTKEKMRESQSARWAALSPRKRAAIGKKIGEANARRVVSAETREKMRVAKIGNTHCVGRVVSAATRAKIALAKLNSIK